MLSLVFMKVARSWAKAEKQGFKVYTAAEAAKQADIIMILINDENAGRYVQERYRAKPRSR